MKNLFETSVLTHGFSNHAPPVAEDKMDQLILLLQSNTNSIGFVNQKLSDLQTQSDARFSEHSEKIEQLESKLDSEILSLNDQIETAFGYADARIDRLFVSKSDDINSQMVTISQTAQSKQDSQLAQMRVDFDHKFSTLSEKVASDLDAFKQSLTPTIQSVVDTYLEKMDIDDTIKKEITTRFATQVGPHAQILDQFKSDLNDVRAELDSFKQSLNFDNDPLVTRTDLPSKSLGAIDRKIEKLSSWLSSLQSQHKSKSRVIDNLELKSRANNLVIDGMMDSPHEDTFFEVLQLLTRFVPHFDSNHLISAYRIGKRHTGGTPRRILISLLPGPTRSLILNMAGTIAKAGLPGARIFINEDIPDDIKRRRSDVYKYVEFLKEKNITAQQKGDSVLIDGKLYKYEELQYLPDGLTIADSRTIRKNGVIAFQSSHSPLSNLYPAPLKRNGIIFVSAEHAFQHAKATICKNTTLARAILDEPNPYDALFIGKRIEVNEEWLSTQLTTMEEILRLKLEQVRVFADQLHASETHHLVENTRCPFWGSGTPFNASSVFTRSYPGANNLGKLLEKIRGNF